MPGLKLTTSFFINPLINSVSKYLIILFIWQDEDKNNKLKKKPEHNIFNVNTCIKEFKFKTKSKVNIYNKNKY